MSQSSDRARERREQAARQREARRRAERRTRLYRRGAIAVALVAVVGAVLGITLTRSSGGPKVGLSPTTPIQAVNASTLGAEGMLTQAGSPLADLSHAATGTTVDGIQCGASEQTTEHIHTHLAIYVNGALRPVEPGIGIVQPAGQTSAGSQFFSATSCYYWLHVHEQDGVIHVEAPAQGTYTLGQFFAIWGQPLSGTQVGPATGTVTAYVNGKAFTGDPTTIALGSREDVQLDVGTVVPPQSVDWSKSQL